MNTVYSNMFAKCLHVNLSVYTVQCDVYTVYCTPYTVH